MSRAATDRLKVNPALGSPPTLEWRAVGELTIDPDYQRSILTGTSQSLIRRIAQFWDWGLCQPLAIARRTDGCLKVVDGQHRLEAARLRRDIPHLPCVITAYATAGDEAAAFVALNQQRRPLNALDLFRAIEPRRVPFVADIQREVAAFFHIPVMEMTSARRARDVARPRQVAMYLAKLLTPKSLPDIGRRFGGRDHTTVIHAVRQIERLSAADPEFAAQVAACGARL